MRQDLYNELRERIVKVVPEIMELKFGCRYRAGGSITTVDGSNYIIEPENKRVRIISICNHPKETRCCGTYQNQDDEPIFERIDEILGRDIQLADVLRAIEINLPCVLGDKWVDMASDGWMFLMFKNGDGHKTFRSNAKWELQLALHEQSDELGEWLMEVIK